MEPGDGEKDAGAEGLQAAPPGPQDPCCWERGCQAGRAVLGGVHPSRWGATGFPRSWDILSGKTEDVIRRREVRMARGCSGRTGGAWDWARRGGSEQNSLQTVEEWGVSLGCGEQCVDVLLQVSSCVVIPSHFPWEKLGAQPSLASAPCGGWRGRGCPRSILRAQ